MTEKKVGGRRRLRSESLVVGCSALLLALVSLFYCTQHHLLLLYGDAVAHLHIARRVLDSLNPGFRQLGSVWLPLPHLLLMPFVYRMSWWQSAVPAAVPSMLCYVAGCVGIYRLARLWLGPSRAAVAAVFYALNPGLLYMQTTAMTEPLFLAEMIWAALLIAEHGRALEAASFQFSDTRPGDTADALANQRHAGRTLLAAGLVLVAAVYTRYDGWIYGAFAWLVVAAGFARAARAKAKTQASKRPISALWRSRVTGAFVLFTVMLAAAPALWVAYNAKQFGDPFDFLRGPYSAKAIEARTSTPGAPHYPGWHSMPVAELHFLKAAEGGAVPWRQGNTLLLMALAGTAYAALRWHGTAMRAALLLWIPAPFYAYSVAYGSVPIFIPIWWPHSWYNTRYGMEMLPAFALFFAMFVAGLASTVKLFKPKWGTWIMAAAFVLTAVNSIVVMRATPLVLAEAYANSKARIPFERELAEALAQLPPHGPILMYTSAHIGALQQAGVRLATTINEGDYYQWKPALDDPAAAAPVVVAIDGDPVAAAVAAHPRGLQLATTVCSSEQPCARIYTSASFDAESVRSHAKSR